MSSSPLDVQLTVPGNDGTVQLVVVEQYGADLSIAAAEEVELSTIDSEQVILEINQSYGADVYVLEAPGAQIIINNQNGGGALADLSDTQIDPLTVQNQQPLVYDSSIQKWKPGIFINASLVSSSIPYSSNAINAGSAVDFTISGGSIFNLLAITTSTPSWIRVYGTPAARAADTRTSPGGDLPVSGGEFYAEVVTTLSPQTIRFAPVPIVQATQGLAYIRMVNMDTVSRSIDVDFLVLILQSIAAENSNRVLLHMDGENNSTTFVDSGPNNLPIQVIGTAKISTSQSVFGGSSAYFDGSGGHLALASSAIFDVISGDFTIAMRVRITGQMGYCGLAVFPSGDDHGLYIYRNGTNDNVLAWYDPNGSLIGTINMNDSQWYSVAAVRRLGVLRLYVEGQAEAQTYSNSSAIFGPSMLIGAFPEYEEYFQGYIDEFIFDRKALYSGNFTPPSTPF